MDIEEIKCPLCTQIYNEEERIPILLPDCGHSFCFSCIYECFELMSDHNLADDLNLNDDDLSYLNEQEMKNGLSHKHKPLFKCPEDGVECSIQNPDNLPKNYALLKIVQKTKESEQDQNKKIIVLKYKDDEQRFVAQKKEDNSLARFLTHYSGSSVSMCSKLDLEDEHLTTPSQEAPTILQKPQQDVQLICKKHNRQLELICVSDKQRICTQCALFGEHKGHDVRMEEDVQKEVYMKVEVLMDMYQEMEKSIGDLNDSSTYEAHYNIYKRKQFETKEKIQEKFKEWRKALRALEIKVIDDLYMTYSQFEDKFQQAVKHNSRMINDEQGWMDKAKQQLDEYTNKTSSETNYIAFDMIDQNNNQADDILNMGEQLLDKSEKQRGYPSLSGMETQYSQVKLVFEPNFEKRLQGIAKVLGPGQTAEYSGDYTTNSQSFLPPFSFNEKEDNEGSVNNENNQQEGALNISGISFNEPGSPINQSRRALNQSEENKDHLDITTTTQQQNNSNSSGGGTTLNENSTGNKSLGMISKLRKMSTTKAGVTAVVGGPGQKEPAKGAKKDLASIFKTQSVNGELDISNKNLSDMHSNDLAKCIKSCSQHIKQLNLSKNRLSDEGIGQIIKALCESQIEGCNISSNKISEKCVETIVGSLKTNKTLKCLDLQNNGIGSRLMKNKLKNALPQIEILL